MLYVPGNVFVPFNTLRTGEKNNLKGSGLGGYSSYCRVGTPPFPPITACTQ